MPADEQNSRLRFARIRRAKFWLRFMPRRARFHTYPIVGRFAAFARKRSYLWSFRYENLRPAFYSGSILTMLPLMGVQMTIGFALCLLLRANFMVMGALQLITNPITAGPIYYGTYKLGLIILQASGFDGGIDPASLGPEPSIEFFEDLAQGNDPAPLLPDGETGQSTWRSIGIGINSLFLGGLIVGAALGTGLDLFWRRLVLPANAHIQARKPVTAVVTPHPDSGAASSSDNPPPASSS